MNQFIGMTKDQLSEQLSLIHEAELKAMLNGTFDEVGQRYYRLSRLVWYELHRLGGLLPAFNTSPDRPHQPKEWQLDPDSLETATVQYWRNGVMVSAQITLENARESVRNGTAFVISGCAIGALNDDFEYAS